MENEEIPEKNNRNHHYQSFSIVHLQQKVGDDFAHMTGTIEYIEWGCLISTGDVI